MKKLISALAGALLLAALVAPAAVTAASKYNPDIWVSQNGTPSVGWGTSCSRPDFDTIAEAVDDVGTHIGDVIHICPGIWYEYGIYSEHANIVLEGEGPSKTIIDPEEDGRFFSTYEDDGGDGWFNSVTVRGMTIRNSHAIGGHGGAIEGGNVTCSNVDFIDNWAEDTAPNGGAGGAIIAWGSYVGNGCRFINNWADENGGALWVQYNVTSTNEYYRGNGTDGDGGSVYHRGWDEGSATFTNAKFFNYNCCDDLADDGGAIYNNDGNLSVTKSQFTNHNVRYDGGAIYSATDNTVRLTSNKFVSNYADSDGGAFYGGDTNQDEYFVGNEFSENDAYYAGGAVYTDSDDSFFRSNLFAYNDSYDDDGDAVWFTDCGGGETTMLGGKWYGTGTKSFNGSNKYTYWDGGKVNVTSYWPDYVLVDGDC